MLNLRIKNSIVARTPSNMLDLGTQAPNFKLPDVIGGKSLELTTIKGNKGTLIMFICNHCPFVIHVNDTLISLANTYQAKGIKFIAISSNDITNYPEDAPELMKVRGKELGYPFPYLFDDSQNVAKDYLAACTPDFFLFDEDLKLTYRGQLDDSRPGNGIPVTGKGLAHAMDCLIKGKKNSKPQKPSIGCGIKWR